MFKSFFDTLNSGFEIPKNTTFSGADIFSMGNVSDFSIQTNLDSRSVRDISSSLNGFSDPITLDSLNLTPDIVNTIFANNIELFLNFDKSKVTNYAYFGSLKEFIRVSIEKILLNFPASLYITNEFDSTIQLTILSYKYDSISDTASFNVPVSAINNKYNLLYTQKSYLLNNSSDLKDISSNYSNYVVWNLTDEFPIINFTGSTDVSSGYLNIQVKGNPFPSFDGTNGLTKFHIKPNYFNYESFLNGLEDFEAYLLNRDDTPKYTASFKEPLESNDGTIVLVDKFYTWPTTDGYNLDYNTYEYKIYLQSLIDLGTKYDDYKSNLISRFLTTSALKEYDTADGKMQKLLNIYGREFDEIKKFIDGLANASKTSYDKKDNIPDTLVKNFAKTLGWGVFNTATDEDLINNFLGKTQPIVYSGQTRNLTPVETDIELWRRLIINSAYLFKSKGTRNCIDFLFKIIGAPESLIDFNEHVYLIDKKIDVSAVTNNVDLNYPFDTDGYPVIRENTPDYYFQMKGGWRNPVEIAPNNEKDLISIVGIHKGKYDNGQYYFDIYRNFGNQKGFNLTKTIDNVKSWVYTETPTDRTILDYNTSYTAEHSKMVLNTKEISIFLDPAKAIETDVYNYNVNTDTIINDIEILYPFPNTVTTRAEVSNMTFLEYVDFVYTRYINVKNRKVISDNQGGGYSTLRALYDYYFYGSDYINLNGDSPFTDIFSDEFSGTNDEVISNQLNFDKIKNYLNIIDNFWISLIEQFIPSTTIWEGGTNYRNTVFDRQKFVYRHGIDDGSEFVKKQDGIVNNSIFIAKIDGKINRPFTGQIGGFETVSSYKTNLFFTGNTTTTTTNRIRYRSKILSNIVSISEPNFKMGQVAKINTGNTEPIIHNISNGDKNIDFTFTGNTNYFSNSSNPFALFNYDIYPYDSSFSGFTNNSIFGRTIYELSGVTGTTKLWNEDVKFSFNDGDYMVRGTYNFTGTTSGTTILPSAYTLNNRGVFNSNLYYNYNIYDTNKDYWFTIISNPPKPIIDDSLFDTGTTGPNSTGTILVNDQLLVTGSAQTTFTYNYKPQGEIIINVNGNSLVQSTGITFADGGEYFVDTTTFLSAIVVTLANPVSNLHGDVVNIIFIRGLDSSLLATESQFITSIPSGTGTTQGSEIYFNTLTNQYEYYFNFSLSINVDFNQLVVILNGNNLIKNVDYYKPTNNQYKIIFNDTIKVGDILVFYYPKAELPRDSYLPSSGFTATWSSVNSGSTGLFTVQITSPTDVNFTSVLYSGTTPYTNSGIYNLFIGAITVPNTTFIYRVKSEKYFTNFLGETFTTTNYSNIFIFKTDNRVT